MAKLHLTKKEIAALDLLIAEFQGEDDGAFIEIADDAMFTGILAAATRAVAQTAVRTVTQAATNMALEATPNVAEATADLAANTPAVTEVTAEVATVTVAILGGAIRPDGVGGPGVEASQLTLEALLDVRREIQRQLGDT